MIDLSDVVPFAGSCGIRRVTAEPEQVVLRLPKSPRVTDHTGAIHPAAVTALAHVATSAVLALNFDLRHTDFRTASLVSRLDRTTRTSLQCAAALPRETVAAIEAALERDGAAECVLAAAIRDTSGDVVAEVEVGFAFRSRG